MSKKGKIISTLVVLLFASIVTVCTWQFDYIKKFINENIFKVNASVTNPPAAETEDIKAAGVYNGGNLTKSWEDFIINNEFIVDENGVLSKGSIDNSTLVGELVLPNNITRIERNTFLSSGITSVIIPKSVKEIGSSCFFDCSELIDVKILGAEKIGEFAFNNCYSIESIELPDNLLTIGGNAFYNCENLKTITIPKGVEDISFGLFELCYSLKTITILGKIKTVGSSAFSGCKELREIILPETITSIGEDAFNNCKKLSTLYIPASVKAITRPFINCAPNLILYFGHSNIDSFGVGDKYWNCYDVNTSTVLECKTSYTYEQYIQDLLSQEENTISPIVPPSLEDDLVAGK